MKKTLRLGITLLIIASLAAAILAFSNKATSGKIAEIELKNTQDALTGIFGEFETYEESDAAEIDKLRAIDENVIAVYKIIDSGESMGYSITTVSNGFGGAIEIMVGIDSNGEILGTRVLKHGETAGIGSKAAEPEFTDLFTGQATSEEIHVETISGATITSNAVIKGVNNARLVYQEVSSN